MSIIGREKNQGIFQNDWVNSHNIQEWLGIFRNNYNGQCIEISDEHSATDDNDGFDKETLEEANHTYNFGSVSSWLDFKVKCS